MTNELTATPPAAAPTTSAEDLGLDRAFLMSMARVPLIAVLWTAAAWAASAAVEAFGWHVTGHTLGPLGWEAKSFNLGPLAVICFGMLLAAFIDGYAFKVPNWCTLSLVVSGWYIGLLHDLGFTGIAGVGGVGAAFACTLLGFALLFPALFIGGMGQGDVKMTMGFGSWVAAYFGFVGGIKVLLWSFAIGVLVGGVFALVMIVLRRQFRTNLQNFREILFDLWIMVMVGRGKATERANERRKDWWRLPYGVPLCVGFIGYLAFDLYRFVTANQ